MRGFEVLVVLGAALFAGGAFGGEDKIALKDAPGRSAVETNCVSCHSLDYVIMNSPFPDRKLWEAEVNKMVKVFGAPVKAEDAQAIIDYLAANYGKK